MATTTEQQNMELMQTLDDAWNSEDQDVFVKRHKPDVVVRWPGKPPTHGVEDHLQESMSSGQRSPINTSITGRTRCSSRRVSGRARSRISPAT